MKSPVEPQIIEISIRELGEDIFALILICNDDIESNILDSMLINYEVRCYLRKDTNLTISIKLKNLDKTIKLDTPRNVNLYPPVKWLLDGRVNLISTGFFENGRELTFNQPKPLRALVDPIQMN